MYGNCPIKQVKEVDNNAIQNVSDNFCFSANAARRSTEDCFFWVAEELEDEEEVVWRITTGAEGSKSLLSSNTPGGGNSKERCSRINRNTATLAANREVASVSS